jgi:hypothetical protein
MLQIPPVTQSLLTLEPRLEIDNLDRLKHLRTQSSTPIGGNAIESRTRPPLATALSHLTDRIEPPRHSDPVRVPCHELRVLYRQPSSIIARKLPSET